MEFTEIISRMDPSLWGSYGWKMIHSYSRLPVPLKEYIRWLKATSYILPCRMCRNNFKRHIRNHKCDEAKSNEYFSVCLHNAVNEMKGKKIYTKACDTLPKPSIKNLFQPEFWSTLYLNTTIDKEGVIREWWKATEYILTLAKKHKEAASVRELRVGAFGDIFTKKQDDCRRLELKKAINAFLRYNNVTPISNTHASVRLGKSLKPRATRKRARKLSRILPSGKTRRASRKRS